MCWQSGPEVRNYATCIMCIGSETRSTVPQSGLFHRYLPFQVPVSSRSLNLINIWLDRLGYVHAAHELWRVYGPGADFVLALATNNYINIWTWNEKEWRKPGCRGVFAIHITFCRNASKNSILKYLRGFNIPHCNRPIFVIWKRA